MLHRVLLAPGFGMAIIEPTQGGESLGVRLGDSADAIAGWRLVELKPRGAVFDGPGGRRALELRTWAGDGEAPPIPAATPTATASQGEDAPQADDTNVPAPTPVQQQMDQIRQRIEARRAQLRAKDQ